MRDERFPHHGADTARAGPGLARPMCVLTLRGVAGVQATQPSPGIENRPRPTASGCPGSA
mgnify:CR=1 FL=1